jgi:hypothetical protein
MSARCRATDETSSSAEERHPRPWRPPRPTRACGSWPGAGLVSNLVRVAVVCRGLGWLVGEGPRAELLVEVGVVDVRCSHNPSAVGSIPTRPTRLLAPPATCSKFMRETCCYDQLLWHSGVDPVHWSVLTVASTLGSAYLRPSLTPSGSGPDAEAPDFDGVGDREPGAGAGSRPLPLRGLEFELRSQVPGSIVSSGPGVRSRIRRRRRQLARGRGSRVWRGFGRHVF